MNRHIVNNRYLRQIPIIGDEGQNKLLNAKVVIVGIGGLGCPVSLYLIQAGITNLTIIDNDTIDATNLHRQILFTEDSIGASKVFSAYEELKKRNSTINITQFDKEIDYVNAYSICDNHDIIVDCSDNFKTKYLLNTVSKELEIPLVTASIFQQEAYVATLNYLKGSCLECIFPETPPLNLIPNCSQSGVLGVDAGIVGLLQAKEVINIIIGSPKLNSKILCVDLEFLEFSTRSIKQREQCSSNKCSKKNVFNTVFTDISFEEYLSYLSKEPGVQIIDCRSSDEHYKNNIGGLNIPLEQLENNYQKLDTNIPTIIYCSTGKRSAIAAQFLLKKNFKEVFCLQGGMIQNHANIKHS